MAGKKENPYYKKPAHRPREFDGPDELWEACMGYFEWVDETPLQESKAMTSGGVPTVVTLPKMRAMTIVGMCLFLGVEDRTWRLWREEREDLLPIITHVEGIIRTQKFEGASADLLNPNIIARELGLSDHNKVEAVVEAKDLSPEGRTASLVSNIPVLVSMFAAAGYDCSITKKVE